MARMSHEARFDHWFLFKKEGALDGSERVRSHTHGFSMPVRLYHEASNAVFGELNSYTGRTWFNFGD